MVSVSGVLAQPWWQGVAGVVQILATLFAVVGIILARRTIQLALEDRQESARPDWVVSPQMTMVAMPSASDEVDKLRKTNAVNLTFSLYNSGFGVAIIERIRYDENPITCGTSYLNLASHGVVPPGGQVNIPVPYVLNAPERPLEVTYRTRWGTPGTASFVIRVERNADGVPECRIERKR